MRTWLRRTHWWRVGTTARRQNRVHFDEEHECLIRFGRRWYGEAVAALQAIGLDPPLGFELL